MRRLACAIAAVAVVWTATAARAETTPEYQLKAAFVSKFPEFTEWPEAALGERSTIELCVARPNPFGTTLSELVAGEMIRGRRLVTREVDSPRAIDSCQVLFVTAESAAARRLFLARAAMLPVLTVGDYPGFLDEGGILNLRLVDGRVRFDVNNDASLKVGVRLGSQLLRLASTVRGGTP